MQPRFLSFRSLLPAPVTSWTAALAAVAAAMMPFSPAAAGPTGPANPAITAFTTCSTVANCENKLYLNESTAGYLFTPQKNVEVTWLGVYDDPTVDGLFADIPVSVWEYTAATTNTSPLATITVPQGTSSTKLGNFRYMELASPLMLTMGTKYVVGAYYPTKPPTIPDDDLDLPQFEPTANPSALFQQLTWNSWLSYANGNSMESGYSGAPVNEMPTLDGNFGGITRGLIGPNMALNPGVPGVPGPLPLLAAPAAWGWSRRLRRHTLKSGSLKLN